MFKIENGDKIAIFTKEGKMFASKLIRRSVQTALGIITAQLPETIRGYTPNLIPFFNLKCLAQDLAACPPDPDLTEMRIRDIIRLDEEYHIVDLLKRFETSSYREEYIEIADYIINTATKALSLIMDSGVWRFDTAYAIPSPFYVFDRKNSEDRELSFATTFEKNQNNP